MNPADPIRDIMHRTMFNLRFIEQRRAPEGPYEVTQLLNSFLGAMAHPWEEFRDALDTMPIEQAVAAHWPDIRPEQSTDERPESLGDLLRLVRNSLAHGNITWLPDEQNEIAAVRIWNMRNDIRTWGAVVRIDDMRQFLDRFVELADWLGSESELLKDRTA